MIDYADERRLWLAILVAGLSDYFQGLDTLWPFSKDFVWVARRAELDPERIQQKLRAGQVAPDARQLLPKPTPNVRKSPNATRPEECDLLAVMA